MEQHLEEEKEVGEVEEIVSEEDAEIVDDSIDRLLEAADEDKE